MTCDRDTLVSVVIPCYNQAEYLPTAITSVLEQTHGNVECVVVDDGSTDATAAVLDGFGARIKAFRQTNAGVAAARNAGFAAASGGVVAFLDSDDFLFPDTIENHVRMIDLHGEAAVFYGGCAYVDQASRELSRVTPRPLPEHPLVALLSANRLQLGAVTVRREAAAKIGFDPALSGCADWDWLIRLAAAGHRFVSVPGALIGYRRHPTSMSTSYARMLDDGLRVMAKHGPLGRKDWRTRFALACGKRSIRYYAFRQALLPQLTLLIRRGRPTEAAKRMIAALFHDLGSPSFFLLDYWLLRFVSLFYRTVDETGNTS